MSMQPITPKPSRRSEPTYEPIDVEAFEPGTRADLRLPLYRDALAAEVKAPFVVVRGAHPGPVVGLCAAVHGDELNGINIIHHVLESADPTQIHGTLLCAPVVNVPAYNAGQRRFPDDNQDLNHRFPGKPAGTPSEQYARAFVRTFLGPCDYLIDLHTASEGRVNSLYVRVDLHNKKARRMALLMGPDIILHGRSGDGTLRNAARVRGIPAITVEAGNPAVFQGRMAMEGEEGIRAILADLGVLRGKEASVDAPPVICRASRWLRIRVGGLLENRFSLREKVKQGQVLAAVRDPFGHTIATYKAPAAGIVIGMSRSPVAVPGTRFCHLGEIGEPPPPRKKG
ncbi:MAG: succinylglutamate desuccinylase/aspartoacylase family protein [Deltaproteobacteria bacterium]|nr:succinylglutamate desuccinylase/aspartoacylase family protein [Deltaproteobacteria bacterium]